MNPNLRPGSFIAAGLTDGRCLIGEVDLITPTHIVLGLKSHITGYYGNETATIPVSMIEETREAFLVDGIVNDRHLNTFQNQWHQGTQ